VEDGPPPYRTVTVRGTSARQVVLLCSDLEPYQGDPCGYVPHSISQTVRSLWCCGGRLTTVGPIRGFRKLINARHSGSGFADEPPPQRDGWRRFQPSEGMRCRSSLSGTSPVGYHHSRVGQQSAQDVGSCGVRVLDRSSGVSARSFTSSAL
jgi:hypothetical protein